MSSYFPSLRFIFGEALPDSIAKFRLESNHEIGGFQFYSLKALTTDLGWFFDHI